MSAGARTVAAPGCASCSHGRDVRSGAVKIPCGFRLAGVKKRRETAARISTKSARRRTWRSWPIPPPTIRPPPRRLRGYADGPAHGRGLDAGRPRRGAALGQFGSRPALPSGRSRRSGACRTRPGAARGAGLRAGLQFLLHRPAPHLPHRRSQRRRDGPRSCSRSRWSTSQLAASIRRQARIADAHAARNATIAGLARRLLGCTSEQEIADVSVRELARDLRLQRRADRGRTRTAHPRQRAGADAARPERYRGGGADARQLGDRSRPRTRPGSPDRMAVSPGPLGQHDPRRHGDCPRRRRSGRPRRPVRSCSTICSTRSRLRWSAGGSKARRASSPASANATGSARSCCRRSGRICSRRLTPSAEAVRELRRSGVGRQGARLRHRLGGRQARTLSVQPHRTSARRPIRSRCRPATSPSTCSGARFPATAMAVHLTPKEYAVLAELAKHPGRVLTHAHLLRTAWGPAQENQTEYLRVAVRACGRRSSAIRPIRKSSSTNPPSVTACSPARSPTARKPVHARLNVRNGWKADICSSEGAVRNLQKGRESCGRLPFRT